jgi:hypothetical protein
VLSVVGLCAWVSVHEAVFQGSINEDGEFPSGTGDRFGLADAEGQPTIGPEGRLGASEIHRPKRRIALAGIPARLTRLFTFAGNVEGQSWWLIVVYRSKRQTWAVAKIVVSGSTNMPFFVPLATAF